METNKQNLTQKIGRRIFDCQEKQTRSAFSIPLLFIFFYALLLLISIFPAAGQDNLQYATPIERKQVGYINITELNFSFGTEKYKYETSFGLQTVNGHLFSPNFSLGLGLGIDKYQELTLMPVFLEARASSGNADIKPFFSGCIGYSFDLGGNNNGLFLNPSAGAIFEESKVGLNFSIGIRVQKRSRFGGTSTFISFKTGVSF